MDAYLSEEAFQTLEALCVISSGSLTDGLLIGHIRGHRYFVEKAFPSQKGFFSSLEKFWALNQLFKHRIIGFYSFSAEDKKTQKILAPFSYGKLFLHITSNKKNKLVAVPYIIDYEKDFFLSPIPLKTPR